MTAEMNFTNGGTVKKLNVVEKYLRSFLAVLSKQKWAETYYVDAFAGSGTLGVRDNEALLPDIIEADELMLGSAIRAANIERGFDHYIFIDTNASNLSSLRDRIGPNNRHLTKMEFIQEDANAAIQKLIPRLQKKNARAVVFLDPFGNQVRWETLKALAGTGAVDLWYLFPAMLGVYRQIKNDGATTTPEQEKSLDGLFGPNDWRSAFTKTDTQPDLFGTRTTTEKSVTVEGITRFMIKCLDEIFKGGVSDKWLPLGRGRRHYYSLIFAMANPSANAKKAGMGIAEHILKNN